MFINLPENFYMKVQYDKNLLIDRKETIIGISLPLGGGEKRWPMDSTFLKDYARRKNAVLKFSERASTNSEQLTQVEDLIKQNIDVLILAPINSKEASIIVDKAKESNIKVVNYDRLIPNSDVDFFVSFNGLNMGELQGRYLTQRAPIGNYIILSGDPDDTNSKLYKEGAMLYIKPLNSIGKIKIVTEESVKDWNPNVAYDIVKKSLIENDNNIDAILAPNDVLAGGSIKALEEQGIAGKVLVTGIDAEPAAIRRILEGTQSMTIFTDFRKEAEVAIDAAINLVENKPLNAFSETNNGKKIVPSLLLTPVIVDRNNIQEVLLNTGYITLHDIYSLQNWGDINVYRFTRKLLYEGSIW